MKFEADEIYTLKFPSSEEMVARVVSTDATTVTVSKPAVIMPMPDGRFEMLAALLSADYDEVVVINLNQIVAATKTRKQHADVYAEATSPIQTPSKKIILG
jgi:MoxR-like ATPase